MTEKEGSLGTPASLRSARDALAVRCGDDPDAATAALLALLSGEGLLLVGPPGSGRRFARAIAEAREESLFERAVGPDTCEDELFGPLSLRALEADRYERLGAGFLPGVRVALLHEVFEGPSAVRNALLAMPDRHCLLMIRTRRPAVPDSLLAPLVPLRALVGPLDDEAFQGALGAPLPAVPPVRSVVHSDDIEVPAAVRYALWLLRTELRERGFVVPDELWFRWVRILRIAAAAEEHAFVPLPLVWLLRMASVEGDPATLDDAIASVVRTVVREEPVRLTRVVQAFLTRARRDRSSDAQQVNEAGQPLYLDETNRVTTERLGPPASSILRACLGWVRRLPPTSCGNATSRSSRMG